MTYTAQLGDVLAQPANVELAGPTPLSIPTTDQATVAIGDYAGRLSAIAALIAHWRLGTYDRWRHGGLIDAVDRSSTIPPARVFGTAKGTQTLGGGAGLCITDALATSTSFDGTGADRLDIDPAPALALTGDLTLLAAINPTSVGGTRTIIGSQSGGVAAPYVWSLVAGVPRLTVGNGAASVNLDAATALIAGRAYLIAVSIVAGNATHYINGLQDQVNGFSQARADGAAGLAIGAAAYGSTSNAFQGRIQDLAVINAALSASDMAILYRAWANADVVVLVVTYASTVLAGSPVSYWRLGEAAGTTAADGADSNPGTYTGGYTLAQAGALTGDADTAVSVNGSTGYVTVLDAANLRIVGDLTIEAWVKPTDYANYNMILTKCLSNVAGPYELRLDQSTGKPVFLYGDGSTATAITGTSAPATGVWSHVVVTVSGNTVTHYLNGATNGTGSVAGQARLDRGHALNIGRREDGNYFKGSLDEVAIYGTALSAAQILAHYNKGIGI